MKNLIKLVLPAVVITMAITASFAFKSADTETIVEEDRIFAVWWYHNTPPNQPRCVPIMRRCDPEIQGPVCTTFVPGVGFRQLFNVPNRNFPPGPNNPCNVILFRCQNAPN
ncbi:DUF6520 family protein [Flavivirga eckloniae]|uniref:Uncharacterized protein n=1 Tax=Flavivirga eckloniae TaxID=1803846 RepID=A0A2K9PPW0_9FLAO|nr:DUF6520 family protein [Flavivirga eckloniae]AUP79076.1 hypothetical protein C1H87_10340 [Flavivirga eckloniae]